MWNTVQTNYMNLDQVKTTSVYHVTWSLYNQSSYRIFHSDNILIISLVLIRPIVIWITYKVQDDMRYLLNTDLTTYPHPLLGQFTCWHLYRGSCDYYWLTEIKGYDLNSSRITVNCLSVFAFRDCTRAVIVSYLL